MRDRNIILIYDAVRLVITRVCLMMYHVTGLIYRRHSRSAALMNCFNRCHACPILDGRPRVEVAAGQRVAQRQNVKNIITSRRQSNGPDLVRRRLNTELL